MHPKKYLFVSNKLIDGVFISYFTGIGEHF
jgi:hypothetical protein